MIISIASGKGGTGKTLIATSLAYSLKNSIRVQLIDCDVEEPNCHVFLKPAINIRETVTVPVPKIDTDKCTLCGLCAQVCAYNAIAAFSQHVLTFPQLCHGCGACSYLCPEKAIAEEGREAGVIEQGNADGIAFAQGTLTIGEAMAPPVIRKVKELAIADRTIIVDVPPGTSCPVVTAVKGSDFCLLVTEPTPFGLNDLALAVATVRAMNIPCGVVLNRDGVGNDDVAEYCRKEVIPILLRIPLTAEIASFYSSGITLAEGMPWWQDNFQQLYEKVKDLSGARNSDNQW